MPSISKTTSSATYGAFSAVFLPTFLTLVSMGFFLRMGWVVALAGPLQTTAVISLALFISFVTALSISSAITNIKMESGGIYFLLSRSFGAEIGSAISLPLFLAQALSTSFYAMGFAEVLHLLFPWIPTKEATLCLLILIAMITLISPKIVLKTEFFVFVCVCLTLLSFYCGHSIQVEAQRHPGVIQPSISFWVLFATFFPIVTGIEGGLSFINHLKKPSRSVPLGILFAIGCACIIYLSTAYLLHLRAPYEYLINPLVMQQLSLIPSIVIIGILGSTFSAALGSTLSAASSLQAFAQDGIIPRVLTQRHITLLIPIAISFLGVSFGSVNAIAPILSMFFLISYGTLNAATGIEALIENPSWRPTLKTHWLLSLIGASLCLIVMFMISPGMSFCAVLFVALLHLFMKKRHLHSSWEDMRYSILLFFSRYAIYKLKALQPSPKTWRPNLLVFVGDPLLRAHLTQLTSALTHKKGFLVISSIVNLPHLETTYNEEKKLSLFLEKTAIPALIKTKYAPNLLVGMKTLIEDTGLGVLSPNTIVLGASEKEEKIPIFAEIIQFAYKNKKNILIIRENGLTQRLEIKTKMHQKKHIDVWWGGKSKNNSELMVIMAYMLQTSEAWKGSTLTLKTAVNIEEDIPFVQKNLDSFLTTSRLHLHTEIALHKE